MVAKGEGVWGRDAPGIQDEQTETFIYRMDKQQGPIVQHRAIFNVPWETVWKRICRTDERSPKINCVENIVKI